MDAASKIAQLVDGGLQLVGRAIEHAGHLVVIEGVELGPAATHVDHQREESLLGAVVEVALEASALGVLGLDESLASRRAGRR